MQWRSKELEGVKRRCSDSDVSVHGKEKGEVGNFVERVWAFQDGVDWTGFAGTRGEEEGVDQVCPGQDVEGVAPVASMWGTCTLGLIAYTEDTR